MAHAALHLGRRRYIGRRYGFRQDGAGDCCSAWKENSRAVLTRGPDPQGFDVILCTYGVLNTEIEALSKVEWNLAVLDEAHAIKNKATQTSHSVMKINAQGRILLSGTPIQNDLSEIWNLFEFANPGYLGSYQQFGDRFILPIEKKKDKEKQHLLKQLISPFILRRTKAEVLDELPEKTELIVPVELSEEELAIYENIRTRTLSGLQSEKINPIEALMALTKLRQAA